MKRIVNLFLFLVSCSQLPLEQELKDLTTMIQVTYVCVEETDKPVAARWDDSSNCLQLNMESMQTISKKYGKDAAKGVWLHELAFLKDRGEMTRKERELAADTFVGCQMKKRNLNPDEYYEYLIHEYVPNKYQGKLMERVRAIQRGYKNCR
jgi:hypothetical protein